MYYMNSAYIARKLKCICSGNRGKLSYRNCIVTEKRRMKTKTRPTSTLQRNAEVLHVLYGLLDNDKEPTDQDAESLRYLYASS